MFRFSSDKVKAFHVHAYNTYKMYKTILKQHHHKQLIDKHLEEINHVLCRTIIKQKNAQIRNRFGR